MYLPKTIIDIHAYYDPSRITIPQYIDLMNQYAVSKVILSPPCTQFHEPDKSKQMYQVQRILLWYDLLRPIAATISKSFYNKNGELHRFWRFFTRQNRPLNKVLHPDNDTLATLIQTEPNRFSMWLWVNPLLKNDLSTIEAKLKNPQVVGLKFHAYWHNFDLATLAPYLEICNKINKPVYVILGFGKSGNFTYLISHFPNTKIIFGYGGFPYFRKVWQAIKGNPNKFIDLTSFHLSTRMVKKAIRTVGPRACFYGSDAPYNFTDPLGNFDYTQTFKRLQSDFIQHSDLDHIFFKNFESHFHAS